MSTEEQTKGAEGQKTDSESDGLDIAPLDDLEDAARSVLDTISRVSSRVLWGSLIAYGLSAVIGISIAFTQGIRDPFFFAAMYIVLFVYILSYIKAHQRQARLRSAITLVVVEALIAFWIFILVDRIPARQVFLSSGDAVSTGAIVMRDTLFTLWGAVGALCITAVGLLVHWLWIGRLRRELQ